MPGEHSRRRSPWRRVLRALKDVGRFLRDLVPGEVRLPKTLRRSRWFRRWRRRARRALAFSSQFFTTAPGFVRFLHALPGWLADGVRHVGSNVREALQNPRHWLPALPAVLALLCWLAFFMYAWIAWTPERQVRAYESHAGEAFIRSDFESARVACERMLQLDPTQRKKALYGIGVALGALGKTDDAYAYLRNIAPLDGGGYAPAHQYLARRLLQATNPPPDQVKLAELHLRHAVALDPDSTDAHLLLGQLYLRAGTRGLAKDHFKKAAEANRDAFLTVAQLSAADGDTVEAEIWARRALAHYRQQMEGSSAPLPKVQCAEAMMLMRDFEGAVGLLERGYQQTTNLTLRTALGRVCGVWLETMTNGVGVAERVALVERGLRYAPRDERLLRHLVDLAGLRDNTTARTRELLHELVQSGQAGATLHFCLGVQAWQLQAAAEAKQHFEIAFQLAPEMPFVANNLTMVVCRGTVPEAQRALGIIDSVLGRFPSEPYFRDTRGHVLARLGRWQEAALEFERSLPALAKNPGTHEAMARAYRELGMTELANEHARTAERLKNADTARR